MMYDINFAMYYWKMTLARFWNETVLRRKVRGLCHLSGDWAYMDHACCEICDCNDE